MVGLGYAGNQTPGRKTSYFLDYSFTTSIVFFFQKDLYEAAVVLCPGRQCQSCSCYVPSFCFHPPALFLVGRGGNSWRSFLLN